MKEPLEISNIHIAVYALTDLGGAERTVFSEDIAARCYELAPARFGWRREPYRSKGWPDKYIARLALEDAKKPENGALVEGTYALELTKDGWRTTAAGVKWLRENRARVETALNIKQSGIAKKEADRFRRRLHEAPLFKRYVATGNVEPASVYQFTDMLNCSPDAALDVVATKFRRVCVLAELVQDAQISDFLAACRAAFPQFALEQAREVRGSR